MTMLVAVIMASPSMMSSAPVQFRVAEEVQVEVGGPSMCGAADRLGEEVAVMESISVLLVATVSMIATMAASVRI